MKMDSNVAVKKPKPTLDQVFAIKRAERPDDAFWQDFEVRLRQKQLAAMIEPTPWWSGFSLYWRRADGLKRWVPVAAAASVACLLVLRLSDAGEAPAGTVRVAALTQAAGPAGSQVAVVESGVGSPGITLARVASGEERVAASAPASTLGQAESRMDREDSLRAVASAGHGGVAVAADTAVINVSVEGAGLGNDSRFGQGLVLAAGVEQASAARVMEEGLAGVNFDAAWQEGVAASDQLDLLKLSPRQARLLAAVEENAAPAPTKALATVRERVVRRLETDDELYASASRVGVSGDRLSLKF